MNWTTVVPLQQTKAWCAQMFSTLYRRERSSGMDAAIRTRFRNRCVPVNRGPKESRAD